MTLYPTGCIFATSAYAGIFMLLPTVSVISPTKSEYRHFSTRIISGDYPQIGKLTLAWYNTPMSSTDLIAKYPELTHHLPYLQFLEKIQPSLSVVNPDGSPVDPNPDWYGTNWNACGSISGHWPQKLLIKGIPHNIQQFFKKPHRLSKSPRNLQKFLDKHSHQGIPRFPRPFPG